MTDRRILLAIFGFLLVIAVTQAEESALSKIVRAKRSPNHHGRNDAGLVIAGGNYDTKAKIDCEAKNHVFSEKFNRCCKSSEIVDDNTGMCRLLITSPCQPGETHVGHHRACIKA
ncbi:uncharacterized protein LOC135494898 [Lineus longissimus]|uniref:uncharacterized protein LOC135494898 n=1 Tax=Lineus longissimus TaxID=88925 RepID=UPI002B4CC9B2